MAKQTIQRYLAALHEQLRLRALVAAGLGADIVGLEYRVQVATLSLMFAQSQLRGHELGVARAARRALGVER